VDRLARLRDLVTLRIFLLTVAVVCSLGTAVVVLAVTTEDVTQHNGLASSDAGHLRLFVDHRPAVLVDAAKTVTNLGTAPVLAMLAVVAAAALWWRGQRVAVAIAPGIALAAAALATSVAKTVVGRARPPIGLRLVNETEPSFPSGHAADSAALFLALGLVLAVFVLRRPLVRAVSVTSALVLAAAVGLSRLVLGVHWPTDVVAGWALGTAAAVVVTLAVTAAVRMSPPDHGRASMLRARLVALLQRQRQAGLRTSHGMA
jgi:undecaprenyl-diphosphatase